ncbi:hypothetical protein [Lederbergia panacisoli]|uniref:hypothetical protein n=1 Tax=Lederbergia panacisoli TaxID=1255251 RepID=UPI00214C6F23|nr:hypothetical protein [Lederbergia panacisoli]MCR2823796.1 hypothetical protein [Lederbergia panacisoli]
MEEVPEMEPIVDVQSFWLVNKGVKLEILCTTFETYVRVSANYFFWDDDEVSGVWEEKIIIRGVEAALRYAQKFALKDFDEELKRRNMKIWNSKRPGTNEPVRFEFFGPVKKENGS